MSCHAFVHFSLCWSLPPWSIYWFDCETCLYGSQIQTCLYGSQIQRQFHLLSVSLSYVQKNHVHHMSPLDTWIKSWVTKCNWGMMKKVVWRRGKSTSRRSISWKYSGLQAAFCLAARCSACSTPLAKRGQSWVCRCSELLYLCCCSICLHMETFSSPRVLFCRIWIGDSWQQMIFFFLFLVRI